jgi:hypothetical protein
MNKEKIEEILKKSKPEKIEISESKAKLRRELLNSNHFAKKTFWNKFLSFKFALRALAIITVIFVLLISDFTPREISAKDIINKVDDMYFKSTVPGKVNYSEGVCVVYGDNQQTVNFKFENWRDPKAGKTKFIRKDLQTNEIIDLKIRDGVKIYTSPDSRIRIVKIQSLDGQNLKLNFAVGIDKNLKSLTEFSSPDKNHLIKIDTSIKSMKLIKVTIQDDGSSFQCSNDTLNPRIMIYSQCIDVDEMNMETPRDIIARLKSQPGVTFMGAKFDEKTGKKVLLLEKGTMIDSLYPTTFSIKIERECTNTSSTQTVNMQKFITTNPEGNKKYSRIEKRETIKINSETGTIYQINIKVIKDGKEENVSELTYQDDKFVDYDSSIFEKKESKIVVLKKK